MLYMIQAVEQTAKETTNLVHEIRDLMQRYKETLRRNHRKIYSQELINNLFRHPYTRIEYIVDEVNVGRQTAGRYLNELVDAGLLHKKKVGLINYYINAQLAELLFANNGETAS